MGIDVLVSPAGFSESAFQVSDYNIREVVFPVFNPTTDVATGTNQKMWIATFDGAIIQDDAEPYRLSATTKTAGVTGTMVVDIHLNGTTIMTTNKLDIETGETSSADAATQPDLTTTTFSAGDVFTVETDTIHTTAAKGLNVTMSVRPD